MLDHRRVGYSGWQRQQIDTLLGYPSSSARRFGDHYGDKRYSTTTHRSDRSPTLDTMCYRSLLRGPGRDLFSVRAEHAEMLPESAMGRVVKTVSEPTTDERCVVSVIVGSVKHSDSMVMAWFLSTGVFLRQPSKRYMRFVLSPSLGRRCRACCARSEHTFPLTAPSRLSTVLVARLREVRCRDKRLRERSSIITKI